MTTTPILGIPEVAINQNQKETTINNAIVWLEGAANDELAVSLATGNAATVSGPQFTQFQVFVVTGHTAAAHLTVPLIKRMFNVDNTGGSFPVTVGGATGATVAVPAGVLQQINCNGTSCRIGYAAASTSSAPTLEIDNSLGAAISAGVVKLTLSANFSGTLTSTGVVNLDLSTTALAGLEHTSNKGAANGYASLDSTGKVPTSQLPSTIAGAMSYQTTWNAATNTPALASGTGTKGFYYLVSVAGTTSLDGIAVWNVGDKAVFNGTVWEKIDGLVNEVISVAGRSGVITLTISDVSGAAPLASPVLTGTPTTPTQSSTDNSQQLVNSQWVRNFLSASGYAPTGASAVTQVCGYTGNVTPAEIYGAIGMGGASLLNVGTTAGTVMAGNDSRVTGLGTMSGQASANVTITGGTIDGVIVGGTTRAPGHFTTIDATTPVAAGSGGTGLASPGTAGNVLTSTGSGWASVATTGVSGNVQTFNATTGSGTWTKPASGKIAVIEIWQAAQGGGRTYTTGAGCCALTINPRGSGGALLSLMCLLSDLPATMAIGIVSGGAGSTSGAQNPGGTTTIGSVLSVPGAGSSSPISSSGLTLLMGPVYAMAGGGGSGGTTGAGETALLGGGNGGAGNGSGTTANGGNGGNPGGGGGAGGSSGTGGSGGSSQVRITVI